MKAALSIAALFTAGASATASFCTSSNKDVCFQWGVPQAAASSGSGNVYFQLRAPADYTWAALGIGRRMAGAQIFVMYKDGDGNVTLSTRAGQGHVMPLYTDRSDVKLLEGSGVQNGQMVANVQCDSCSGLDLGGQTNWIAAWSKSEALSTTDKSATIPVHDDKTTFTVDLAQAVVSSDANPFVESGTGTNRPAPAPGSGSGSDGAVQTGGGDNTDTLVLAHGIVLTVVFAAAYPIGAILLAVVPIWWIHAVWQSLAFLGMWAGFALGYVSADRKGIFFDQPHTRLGTIVIALLGIQPALGWIHHQHFKKHQKRGLVSYVHIFYGQVLMVLGIINGGLGLSLADASRGFIIAYSVIAGIFGLLYIAAAVFRQARRASRRTKSPQGSLN